MIALLVLWGGVIGVYSAYAFLKKSSAVTTMRSRLEAESPFRIHHDEKMQDNKRSDENHPHTR